MMKSPSEINMNGSSVIGHHRRLLEDLDTKFENLDVVLLRNAFYLCPLLLFHLCAPS